MELEAHRQWYERGEGKIAPRSVYVCTCVYMCFYNCICICRYVYIRMCRNVYIRMHLCLHLITSSSLYFLEILCDGVPSVSGDVLRASEKLLTTSGCSVWQHTLCTDSFGSSICCTVFICLKRYALFKIVMLSYSM